MLPADSPGGGGQAQPSKDVPTDLQTFAVLLRRMNNELNRVAHDFARTQRLHPTDVQALVAIMDGVKAEHIASGAAGRDDAGRGGARRDGARRDDAGQGAGGAPQPPYTAPSGTAPSDTAPPDTAPMTPGLLREQLNLTSGAVTACLDRLERAGHIRRTRDAADRRVVHLHYEPRAMAVAREYFGPLARGTEAVRRRFSEEELAVVVRFLAAMNDELMALHSSGDGSPDD